jgi:hypothetical protein
MAGIVKIIPDDVVRVRLANEWWDVEKGTFIMGKALVVGGGGVLDDKDWFAFKQPGSDDWIQGPATWISLMKESP